MKRVQHFIPRFILKRFLDKGSLTFFNKGHGKYSKKSSKGSMYKEYFYEHDDFNPNEIENLLAERENFYAPVIEKILNHESLTLEEHKILLEFRHTTYYRSNEFVAFHGFKKGRAQNDWMERLDRRTINGIYESENLDKDIKKSQLDAIKSVIARKDSAYSISALTPICFVFTSKNRKFMVSDSGSLYWGSEFDGMVVIVVDPLHAIMFPRLKQALEIMKNRQYTNKESNVIYENAPDDIVDMINDRVLKGSFEYYIDPN